VTVELAFRLKVPDMYLVVNKVPEEYDLGVVKNKVEQAYNCQVAALLPLSIDIAQNASSKVFSLENPHHPFSDGIRAAVKLLLE
jgi:MinD-like ATPase involved in chromosome partitioning or flagellar assembly